jgi:hypothetical protein
MLISREVRSGASVMLRIICTSTARLFCIAGILGLSASAVEAADAPGAQIGSMLADLELWGDDGLAAIAAIGYWKRLGETTISVYPDKVVSGSSFSNQEEAKSFVTRLSEATKRPLPRLRAGDASVTGKAMKARAGAFKADFFRLIEDDSLRVGWKGSDGSFLKPNVPMRTVIARYGEPQKTTSQVVHAQGDRRPAILTIHEYGGGAVKFVESDQSLTPGVIDRAVLDTQALVRDLYVSEP